MSQTNEHIYRLHGWYYYDRDMDNESSGYSDDEHLDDSWISTVAFLLWVAVAGLTYGTLCFHHVRRTSFVAPPPSLLTPGVHARLCSGGI